MEGRVTAENSDSLLPKFVRVCKFMDPPIPQREAKMTNFYM